MLLTNSGWIRSLSSWAFEVPDLSVVWRRPLAACMERTGGPKDTSCLEQGRWRKHGLTTGGHWREMDQQWIYRYLSPGRTNYSLLDQTSTEDNTWSDDSSLGQDNIFTSVSLDLFLTQVLVHPLSWNRMRENHGLTDWKFKLTTLNSGDYWVNLNWQYENFYHQRDQEFSSLSSFSYGRKKIIFIFNTQILWLCEN